MKHIRLFLFCSLLIFCITARSQNSYMIKNDTTLIGIQIIENLGNAKYLKLTIKQGKQEITYTPEDVEEFGMNGTIYISLSNPLVTDGSKIFMERIVSDEKSSVYYFTDKTGSHLFFQESGGNLQPIDEITNPYFSHIQKLPDAQKWLGNYSIKPTRKSIKYANKLLNAQNTNLLTRPRFGLWIGGGLSSTSNSKLPQSDSDKHFLLGAFADIPFYQGFSLHPELFFMKEKVLQGKEQTYSYDDYIYNRKAIVFPILFRYTIISMHGKTLPFFQVGPAIYYNINSELSHRNMQQEQNGVSTKINKIIDKENYFTAGVSAGFGVEYKLTKKRSLFIDARYAFNSDEVKNHLLLLTVSVNL